MGYKSTKYSCDNQACIKEKHFQPLLSPALAKWAWLPLSLVPWPPVPCVPAAGRSSPRSHPSPPAPSSPGHSPRGVASAADAAFVSPTSTCRGIARGRCCANPQLSSCSPSALSSCGHKRGKGSQRRGGRRMETKAGWIFPGPSQIYSTKNLYSHIIERRDGISADSLLSTEETVKFQSTGIFFWTKNCLIFLSLQIFFSIQICFRWFPQAIM